VTGNLNSGLCRCNSLFSPNRETPGRKNKLHQLFLHAYNSGIPDSVPFLCNMQMAGKPGLWRKNKNSVEINCEVPDDKFYHIGEPETS